MPVGVDCFSVSAFICFLRRALGGQRVWPDTAGQHSGLIDLTPKPGGRDQRRPRRRVFTSTKGLQASVFGDAAERSS